MKKICEECGAEYTTKHINQACCSRKCAGKKKGFFKKCRQCGIEFKAPQKSLRNNYCSMECYQSFQTFYYRIHLDEDGNEIKRCCGCKKILPVGQFWKDKTTKNGCASSCKVCAYARSERYRKSAKYKLHLLAVGKKPMSRFGVGKFSAKKRGYQWLLTFDEYLLLINKTCHYCNGPLDQCGGGLDRKNNETVYSSETCVPCCGRCNSTFMDFYSYSEKLILAEAIKQIDAKRLSIQSQNMQVDPCFGAA